MTKRIKQYRFEIGDFVCCNGAHLHRKDMNNPYWHLIGVVEKKIDRVSGFDYEIRFPKTGAPHQPERIILTNSGLRPATRSEGEAAFFIEIVRAQQAAEAKHSKLMEAAKASAARASLSAGEF